MNEIQILPMVEAHWPAVSAIYEQGIQTSQATFQSAPPANWEEWRAGKLNACSLVAKVGGQIAGWAALSPFSRRPCYAGVAEVSLYVGQDWRGQGIGDALFGALIERAEAEGIWTLQAKIFPENEASLHLHAKHGFRRVGVREKLAQMSYGPWQGQWRDVVLMERRSIKVGV
jgi:L-amino acid N-acyltransferase YncA